MFENGTLLEEDFALLQEDRAFVDYFNIYLSLPIFGQHVIFNFLEKEFSYEPPIIKRRNFVDRRRVVNWLCNERFPGFAESRLFIEYILCNQIRDVKLQCLLKEGHDEDDVAIFTRNVLGSAIGMQVFRDSLLGTSGEKCYRCWLDLERLRRMQPGDKRQRLIIYIKNMYLKTGAPHELETPATQVVFEGKLNFDLIPEEAIQEELIETYCSSHTIYKLDTVEALCNLQKIILVAIKSYWVPRYLLGLLRNTHKALLAVLKRASPYDKLALNQQRQVRCNLLFPNIYTSETPTKALVSTNTDEYREMQSALSEQEAADSSTSDSDTTSPMKPCSPEEPEREVNINDLLTLAGGGKLTEMYRKCVPSVRDSQESLDFYSPDPARNSRNQAANTKTPSFTAIRPTMDIPPSLLHYVSGSKRIKTGMKPKCKVMVALAADNLAGSPMQSFLNKKGEERDEKLLEFWKDIRQYLDGDDTHRDEFGNGIKAKLAHDIFNRYLSSESGDILSESMKMAILSSLSSHDDSTLMIFVQDYITQNLKNPWKHFLSYERKTFRRKVCGDRYFDRNVLELPEDAKDMTDPLLLFNTSQSLSPEAVSSDYRPKSGCISGAGTPWSRESDPSHVPLTDEQTMKAFEFTVSLVEYGRPGLFSYQSPNLSDIIDILYSDYGSLHINKISVTRHEHLYQLVNKPKIDIANLKVSRQVIFDRPSVGVEGERPRGNRLVLRRDGLLLDRPDKPRTFNEVLNSNLHYEFFKRFMAGQKMPYPLAFWKNIEELREMPPGRMRTNMISNVLRKYFSRAARSGALLDCTDDIIRQIPTMEKVPLGVLSCAQASVFRSMERKWYPKYLETFPPDSETDQTDYSPQNSPKVDDVKEEKPVTRARRMRKRKTLQLWQGFISIITGFLKSMKDPNEIQLLELYLRKELYKTSKAKREPSKQKIVDKNALTPSYMPFQTRIVLKNRLIIVDKLQMDLRFWCEVHKYVDQVDHVKKLENITQQNLDFLHRQANAIVEYHLSSEIPPRNQLNIPSDLAQNIINTLANEGATRGLFHDAIILLFPLLYHFWRQCQKEWLKKHTAAELLQIIDEEKKSQGRPGTPHKEIEVPDFLRIRVSEMKVTTLHVQEEDTFTINFSLYEGCKIILPHPKVQPKSTENRRKSVMGKRPSIAGRESAQNVHELSPKEKGKDKDKDKRKQKHSRKMESVAEDDGSMTPRSPQKKSSKSKSFTPVGEKKNLIDNIVENAQSPSRLRKMEHLVTAAVQDDIDQDLFGDVEEVIT